jgi:putative sigma-54 modulation protein
MTIEFETPYGKISEKLINKMRNEIMKLSHLVKNVVRVEVMLKEDATIVPTENKVCSIKLTIFGDNLVAHARSQSFSKAANDAIKYLRKRLNPIPNLSAK